MHFSAVSVIFSEREIELFERRFEEHYDLPDAKYEKWLSIYHTETGNPDSEVSTCKYMLLCTLHHYWMCYVHVGDSLSNREDFDEGNTGING